MQKNEKGIGKVSTSIVIFITIVTEIVFVFFSVAGIFFILLDCSGLEMDCSGHETEDIILKFEERAGKYIVRGM